VHSGFVGKMSFMVHFTTMKFLCSFHAFRPKGFWIWHYWKKCFCFFNLSAITPGLKDMIIVTCTNKLIFHVLLQQAYLEQKCYIRYIIWKFRDCFAQELITRLFEINQYLIDFLYLTLNEKWSTDALLDFAGFAIPTAWQNTICLVNAFDLLMHNEDELIEFCQKYKFIELPPPHQLWLDLKNNGNRQSWSGKLTRSWHEPEMCNQMQCYGQWCRWW